ncbi:terminase large subunit [Evansella cellulosilytica]|uniref:Terminase n=1 Tax=Evansella cellulosilytica (strain ATCC 21833 / DSM 2522 / FERM P-1141 / JCM 9156 / N-4) TaxID=649639 RepID=E6TVH2_EVAC2|nr:terminase TerL endonuclease subunit [Evansella cellulosilytica]ADU30989.1 Terminase [Evansella cellulosilytica DSM 2522]
MTTATLTKLHPTTQYADDVVKGRIVAGKYVRLSCKRHLNDLERQGTKDFPYVFDEEKATKVFEFSEKRCKHIEDGLTVKKGDPVILDDFLQFIVGSVFGWVHKDTGLRRFRKAYEQVGRKNSKSTTLGVVGLKMFAADGEGGPQVYTAATQKDQAKITYGVAEKMAELDKALKKRIRFQRSRSIMTHKNNGGRMMPLSRETKSMDGFNPHCGIIDEYHAHKTTEMYDIIVSGMGMRSQPLIFIITTAGFDINSPCYDEYKYCKEILEGKKTNEEYFIYIAEMDEGDDINDDRNWIKCNPLLAKTKAGRDYLKQELKIAQDQPSKRRGVMTKNFNIWLDQKDDGYMKMGKWAKCGESEDNPFPDVRGRKCFVGLDLSKKIDLTSVSFEFPLDDGRYAILSHSFIPEETLKEKMQTDSVPYDEWVREGWITETRGARVDYKKVQKYIIQEAKKNNWEIVEVAYDEWSAGLISQELEESGFDMVEIPQRINHLSEPTKNFRELVYDGLIIHNNNPVLTWAFSNAVEMQDQNENIKLDKKKSKERIDPAAATINAHARAWNPEKEAGSVYEKRGVRTL